MFASTDARKNAQTNAGMCVEVWPHMRASQGAACNHLCIKCTCVCFREELRAEAFVTARKRGCIHGFMSSTCATQRMRVNVQFHVHMRLPPIPRSGTCNFMAHNAAKCILKRCLKFYFKIIFRVSFLAIQNISFIILPMLGITDASGGF